MGDGSKANHLAYVGDANGRERVNIGAGTIIANYDGANKHRTKIEDDVHTGSNSVLVAPITVGAGATIAAGSTVAREVPPAEAHGGARAPDHDRRVAAADQATKIAPGSHILMRLKPYLMLLLAAVVCSGALADSDDVPADVAAKLSATLKERIPELHIEAIHTGPMPGLYELNAGTELLYINEAGTLIFAGRLIDTKSRHGPDRRALERYSTPSTSIPCPSTWPSRQCVATAAASWRYLPTRCAPTASSSSRRCRALPTSPSTRSFIRSKRLHPGASVKSVEIWCSKDRSSAWSKWMVQKVSPDETQLQRRSHG